MFDKTGICLGCAGIKLSLEAHPNFWPFWQWKLDPYRVSSKNGASPDVKVSLVPSPMDAQQGSLVSDEMAGFWSHRVYRSDSGELIWQYERTKNGEVVLKHATPPTWDSIILLADHSKTYGQLAFEYLGQMMPSILLRHGCLSFHGVLMEYNGRGIIISATSGTGKTTHARLWRDSKRALIINGDRATCRKVDGVWTGYGLPWSGTSGEQINRSVPICAMVALERGEQNEAACLHGMEAFGAMWPHVLYPNWDQELTENALDLADDFLQSVPVIRLKCRPDLEAVEVLHAALEEFFHD